MIPWIIVVRMRARNIMPWAFMCLCQVGVGSVLWPKNYAVDGLYRSQGLDTCTVMKRRAGQGGMAQVDMVAVISSLRISDLKSANLKSRCGACK